MGLETGNRIEDLNSAWPLGTDGLSESDDHHRLTKGCIQGSFPSLGSSAVTVTADEINTVVGAGITPPPEVKVSAFVADGVWTKTAGMLSAKITVTGGGGGGGAANPGFDDGGGGGAGGTSVAWLDISAVTDAAITVPAVAAGMTDGGNAIYDDTGGGGASVLTGNGGQAGASTSGGAGGNASGGLLNTPGGAGRGESGGGNSMWGGGGAGTASTGGNYGGGGGGEVDGGSPAGAGGVGLVLIEESSAALV